MSKSEEYRFVGCPPNLSPHQRASIIREYLYCKQHGLCYYCDKETFLPVHGQKKMKHFSATLDHRVPISKGGKSDFSNLVMACNRCNTLKGSKIR